MPSTHEDQTRHPNTCLALEQDEKRCSRPYIFIHTVLLRSSQAESPELLDPHRRL